MVPADSDLYFITKRRQFHLIIHNFPPCCIISLLPIGLAGVSSAFRGIRSQSVQQNPMHDVKLFSWLAGAAWYEHHGWVSPNPVWEVSVMKVVDRRMTGVTAAPGGPTENEWETAFFGCPIVSGDWGRLSLCCYFEVTHYPLQMVLLTLVRTVPYIGLWTVCSCYN